MLLFSRSNAGISASIGFPIFFRRLPKKIRKIARYLYLGRGLVQYCVRIKDVSKKYIKRVGEDKVQELDAHRLDTGVAGGAKEVQQVLMRSVLVQQLVAEP